VFLIFSARDVEKAQKSSYKSSSHQDANQSTPEKEIPANKSPHKKHKYVYVYVESSVEQYTGYVVIL